jgi:hypothetical protein
MKSFEMFLHSFEKVIINELVQQNNSRNFGVDKLLKVAFRFYDKNLFEHALAKGLSQKITYGYQIGDADISEYLDKYRNKEYKETPLLDNFEAIAQLIADESYEGDLFKASLLMVYDVCIRKEL